MRCPALLGALLVTLHTSGCVLSAEDCGVGFEDVEGRCVAAAQASPFRGGMDGGADGGVERDGGMRRRRDASTRPEPRDPWAAYDSIRINDITVLADLRARPDAPGVDIDAVEAHGEDLFGFAHSADGEIGDPLDANRFIDVRAAIGPEDGQWVSLGGGELTVQLELSRPLRSGDAIRVVAQEVGRFEVYEVFVCTSDLRCDPLSVGEGREEFILP